MDLMCINSVKKGLFSDSARSVLTSTITIDIKGSPIRFGVVGVGVASLGRYCETGINKIRPSLSIYRE